MMIEAYGHICIYLVTWTIGLIFLAAIDVLDFHVCIKDAGHCKIIDPTKFDNDGGSHDTW